MGLVAVSLHPCVSGVLHTGACVNAAVTANDPNAIALVGDLAIDIAKGSTAQPTYLIVLRKSKKRSRTNMFINQVRPGYSQYNSGIILGQ